MTIAKSIYCPMCREQIFHVKLQADDSLLWREWPFFVECPLCNEIIDLTYDSQKDNFKKNQKVADMSNPGLVVAYSASLPTPDTLYYKDYQYPGPFSVYMEISNMFNPSSLVSHGARSRAVEEGIVKYRTSLSSLFAKLNGSKTNIKAFNRKMREELDLKNENVREPQSVEECYAIYQGLCKTVMAAINYNEGDISKFFDTFIYEFSNLEPEIVKQLIKEIFDTNEIFVKEARRYLFHRFNEAVKDLKQILPAFLLDEINPTDEDLRLKLNVVTSTFEGINEIYERNYTGLARFLPFIMAVWNQLRNGDFNKFVAPDGSETPFKLKDFIGSQDGKRIRLMKTLPVFENLIGDTVNHHIRNGIDHDDTEYDNISQTGIYVYEVAGGQESESHRLIDIAYACVNQIRMIGYLCRMVWIAEEKIGIRHG